MRAGREEAQHGRRPEEDASRFAGGLVKNDVQRKNIAASHHGIITEGRFKMSTARVERIKRKIDKLDAQQLDALIQWLEKLLQKGA